MDILPDVIFGLVNDIYVIVAALLHSMSHSRTYIADMVGISVSFLAYMHYSSFSLFVVFLQCKHSRFIFLKKKKKKVLLKFVFVYYTCTHL